MATMYPLFFGLLLATVCGIVGTGDCYVVERYAYCDMRSRLIMNNAVHEYPELSFLKARSSQKIRDDRDEYTVRTSAQDVAFVQRTKDDDLLQYGEQGRGATVLLSDQIAGCKSSRSLGEVGGMETSEGAVVAKRSRFEHRANSLDLCGTFYQEKVARPSANEDGEPAGRARKKISTNEVRNQILTIATAELGVREAIGLNDGKRVEEYLRYTDLGKGHPWCAAFVSWCYGQAGLSQPRNPWSPALFPKARTYVPSLGARGTSLDAGAGLPTRAPVNQADIFGIYGATARRINHVGLVRDVQGKYLITIEGNSNDRVESRRRHLSTIYTLANWVIQ